MDIWWTLHLKRDPASVPLARRILLSAMDTADVDPQVAHDLGVALTEACANAVEHAVGGRPDDGFQVTASITGDRLRVEVVDSGPGLPGSALPPALPAAPVLPALPAAPAAGPALGAGAAPSRPALPRAVPVLRRAGASPARAVRPAVGHRRGRRGRAALSVPVLTAHRPRRTDRPAPYDTHVLPCPPLRPSGGPTDGLFGLQDAAGPPRASGPADLAGAAAALSEAGAPEQSGSDQSPLDQSALDQPGPELPALDAESGRGLFLIHALTDHVQLRNHPLRGAIVSFDKILKRRDGSLLRAVS
ncbi:ATP-binding protein [Saccharothrix sp. ST-888]|uniref:ATP-binding protein n=1 Tax=Saccharothrix sp. ST-888 TaxID=1427391 RepID=UPI000695F239|nr:ATP-binding protein [Saccharothrix sp. ST-888]